MVLMGLAVTAMADIAAAQQAKTRAAAPAPPTKSSSATASAHERAALSASDIFKKTSNAIVTISTATGFGSGVLIDSAGVVVTNFRVIEGANKASVRLSNGDVYDDVSVVDHDLRKDLVLLKIK